MADVHEFGHCPCGGTYEAHNVEVRMHPNQVEIVLPDVAQGRCGNCGARVYAATVLRRLESLMRGRPEVVAGH